MMCKGVYLAHTWGKWQEYVRAYAMAEFPDRKATQIWQRRECERCGYSQRIRVTDEAGHPLIEANP